MLIGFTIMQTAFAGGGALQRARRRRRAAGAGDDRGGRRDLRLGRRPPTASTSAARSRTSSGLERGALEGPAAGWLDVLHPLDRDRYSAALDGILHAALGPHPSRPPAARRRRAIRLVPAEGAAGAGRRRRRHPGDRHVRGRHREPGRRRAHPARRDPRQSDRPAQSRIVLRSAGERRWPRRGGRAVPGWSWRCSTSTGWRRSTPRTACRSAIPRC